MEIRDAQESDLPAIAEMITAVFLHGGALTDDVRGLYERCAIGSESYECFVSGEAFHVLADLAGQPMREIVRGLPSPDLSRVPARSR